MTNKDPGLEKSSFCPAERPGTVNMITCSRSRGLAGPKNPTQTHPLQVVCQACARRGHRNAPITRLFRLWRVLAQAGVFGLGPNQQNRL